MELFKKNRICMHLVSTKTSLSPCYIFSKFQGNYTEVCINIILNIPTNYSTKYTAYKY